MFLQDHGLDDCGNYHNVKGHQPRNGIPTSWILLDNQSTVDVFANCHLLHHIWTVGATMQIHCNAGISHTNQVGNLPGYRTVWFHPSGIANILSLSHVKQKYHMTFDSTLDNHFIVHKPNGAEHRLQQSTCGLCYHNTNSSPSASLLVTTVHDKKSGLTAQEYSQACLAWKLQCIIGCPSTKAFLQIIDMNLLPNCPISHVDVLNVEHIFGPDVGSLKGKTVQQSPHPVQITTFNVPAHIMEQCHHVQLAGDIMYVNKIPFLVTVSHWIKFGTVEVLYDKKLATLIAAI